MRKIVTTAIVAATAVAALAGCAVKPDASSVANFYVNAHVTGVKATGGSFSEAVTVTADGPISSKVYRVAYCLTETTYCGFVLVNDLASNGKGRSEVSVTVKNASVVPVAVLVNIDNNY